MYSYSPSKTSSPLKPAGRFSATQSYGTERSQSSTRIIGQSTQGSSKRNNSVGRITKATIPNVSPVTRQINIERQEIAGPYLDPQPDHLKGRKTLVLDIDETLIHSVANTISKPDFVIKADYGYQKFYVLKRPYLDEFLARVSEVFEVVAFTCGDKQYASKIIKNIDTNNVIQKILHREYCSVRRGLYTKDIGKLGRDLKDVIFVDNWETSFMLQPENGYKIKDFINNKKDTELRDLLPFLEHLNTLDDVRPVQKRHSDFIREENERRRAMTQETNSGNTTDSPSLTDSPNVYGRTSMNSNIFTPTKITMQGSASVKPFFPIDKKAGKGYVTLNALKSMGNRTSLDVLKNQSMVADYRKGDITIGNPANESYVNQTYDSGNIFQSNNHLKTDSFMPKSHKQRVLI